MITFKRGQEEKYCLECELTALSTAFALGFFTLCLDYIELCTPPNSQLYIPPNSPSVTFNHSGFCAFQFIMPEGKSWKRLCPGCDESVMIFPACFLIFEEHKSRRLGGGAPIIFSVVHTVCCSLFLSCLWLLQTRP